MIFYYFMCCFIGNNGQATMFSLPGANPFGGATGTPGMLCCETLHTDKLKLFLNLNSKYNYITCFLHFQSNGLKRIKRPQERYWYV